MITIGMLFLIAFVASIIISCIFGYVDRDIPYGIIIGICSFFGILAIEILIIAIILTWNEVII